MSSSPGTRRRRVIPAAAVLAAVGSCAGPASAAPAPRFPATQALERLGTEARYAFVNRAVAVLAAPGAPRDEAVGRLGLRTEDRTDELVSVIARTTDAAGDPWLRVRLPIRPNGTTGWVPRDALGQLRVVRTWLRIDRRRLRMTLVRRGRVVFRARVGVGRPRWPTPAGTFYVRNRLSGRALGTIYGPLAFGTSARSAVLTDWPGGGVIGIHGTNEPWLLPGRVSHGCIRLRNRDIRRLGRLLPVGTPITIR